MAQIIDGKALAAAQYEQMRLEIDSLEQKYGRRPGLWAVIVGEDPASQVYVRNKENAARKVGLAGEVLRLPESTTQEELLALLAQLNADVRVDGILLQSLLHLVGQSVTLLSQIAAFVHAGQDLCRLTQRFHCEEVGWH